MTTKKLYRDEENLIIAGICSGLADYFGIDVTLIRIIFVLLLIGGGSGFLIYIVLWIMLPLKGDEKEVDYEENIKKTVKDLGKKAKTMAKEIKKEIKVEKVKTGKRQGNFFGLTLMVLGVLILVEKIVPIFIRWDYVWPIILITFGAYLIFRD
jgi:phage shock protein C